MATRLLGGVGAGGCCTGKPCRYTLPSAPSFAPRPLRPVSFSHRLLWAVPLSLGCAAKSTDSGVRSGDSAAPSSCEEPVDDVQPGLQVDCGTSACTLEVVSTSPAPPDRGDNTWQLQVLDTTGAPAVLRSLSVAPFMPAHDHGTAPATFDGTAAGSVWSVGPFDLFMSGRWELRTSFTFEDGTADTAVISFCVEG